MALRAASALGLVGGYVTIRYATAALPALAAAGTRAAIAAVVFRLDAALRPGGRRVVLGVVLVAIVVALAPSAVAFRAQACSFDDAPAPPPSPAREPGPGTPWSSPVLAPALAGSNLPPHQQRGALADRSRVWVVGTMAVAAGGAPSNTLRRRPCTDTATVGDNLTAIPPPREPSRALSAPSPSHPRAHPATASTTSAPAVHHLENP